MESVAQASYAIDWALLSPVLIVMIGAVVGVLLEAGVPRAARWRTQVVYTLVVLVAALFAFVGVYATADLGHGVDPLHINVTAHSVPTGELIIDPLAAAAQVITLVCAILGALVIFDRTRLREGAFAGQPADTPGSFDEDVTERRGYQRSEIAPLLLFSTGGMMLFPMCASMLTLFVCLEIMSLPLYVLCATARHRRLLSQESALKYFVLGAFASAFFLMGIALLFGYAGSLSLAVLARAVGQGVGSDALLVTGSALLIVGLLFKIGAAPFHAWTPDVYQGAPTPITGFMAAGVKVAAFGALARFYFTVGAQARDHLHLFLVIVIVLTLIVGTFFGLVQANIKRMLAYSSIAHAAFVLIALASLAPGALSGIMFYVLTYGVASVGAFGIIYLVRARDEDGNPIAEEQTIARWAGLGRTHPWLAAAMTVFLLSFAGIPLTAGFVGKWMVFAPGVRGGELVLVILAILASATTAFYYFRIIRVMFFEEPADQTVVVTSQGTAAAAITIAAILTVVLGVFPTPILALLHQTAIVIM